PGMADKVSQRIDLLRTELRLKPWVEFKFNKLTKIQRVAFLKAIFPYSFFYYGICIDKAKLTGEGFRVKESFYKYACQLAFLNAKPHLDQATVFIDGSGEKTFRRELQQYLKSRINQQDHTHLRDIKTVDSSKNNLIQMVDMIAGAINRSLGTKSDAIIYRKIINAREIYVQMWPKGIKKPKP
ncbi:MAG: DUF3800 domain-containing protein, partial [Elusimicrobia bacterium]|nr:DUF3800 domain-containing protein [Candidatus Obscuribacterium magneticum]